MPQVAATHCRRAIAGHRRPTVSTTACKQSQRQPLTMVTGLSWVGWGFRLAARSLATVRARAFQKPPRGLRYRQDPLPPSLLTSVRRPRQPRPPVRSRSSRSTGSTSGRGRLNGRRAALSVVRCVLTALPPTSAPTGQLLSHIESESSVLVSISLGRFCCFAARSTWPVVCCLRTTSGCRLAVSPGMRIPSVLRLAPSEECMEVLGPPSFAAALGTQNWG